MLSPADVVLHGEEVTTRVYTLGPKARTALERRSLSSEHFRYRRWNPTLRDASIPHQIFVNRLAQRIGGATVPEHLLPVPDKNAARNRPDAVIEGVDIDGQTRWLGLEVDLGHYSRERITGKVEAWRDYPDPATLVIVVPDEARRARVDDWVGPVREVRVITSDAFGEEIQRAHTPSGEGQLFDLDLWTGGDAFVGTRERLRRVNEMHERQIAADEEAMRERAAAEAERRAAAEAARRAEEQRRERRGRRRFGV